MIGEGNLLTFPLMPKTGISWEEAGREITATVRIAEIRIIASAPNPARAFCMDGERANRRHQARGRKKTVGSLAAA